MIGSSFIFLFCWCWRLSIVMLRRFLLWLILLDSLFLFREVTSFLFSKWYFCFSQFVSSFLLVVDLEERGLKWRIDDRRCCRCRLFFSFFDLEFASASSAVASASAFASASAPADSAVAVVDSDVSAGADVSVDVVRLVDCWIWWIVGGLQRWSFRFLRRPLSFLLSFFGSLCWVLILFLC